MSGKLIGERIKGQTLVCILLVLHLGSFGVFGRTQSNVASVFLSWMLACLLSVPVIMLWAYLTKKMPSSNLFSMLEQGFGTFFGRIITLLYAMFFLLLAASTQFFHADMTRMLVLNHTPFVVLLLLCALFCIHLAKAGTQALGKWCVLLVALTALGTVLFFLFSAPLMQMSNLFPLVLDAGSQLFKNSIRFFAFSIGNTVVVLALYEGLGREMSTVKVFFAATVMIALFSSLVFLRDTAILGQGGLQASLYPAYKAAGLIELGGTGTRVEVFVLLFDLLRGLTKTAVCILAAAGAFARVFQCRKNSALMFATCLTVILALFAFPNVLSGSAFLQLAPVFQLYIPALLCVTLAFRMKNRKIKV